MSESSKYKEFFESRIEFCHQDFVSQNLHKLLKRIKTKRYEAPNRINSVCGGHN